MAQKHIQFRISVQAKMRRAHAFLTLVQFWKIVVETKLALIMKSQPRVIQTELTGLVVQDRIIVQRLRESGRKQRILAENEGVKRMFF